MTTALMYSETIRWIVGAVGAVMRGDPIWRQRLFGFLVGTGLSRVDVRGADLTSASLVDASLRGVVLTGANLTGAYLARADLTGAKLIDAHLTMADFSSAKLIKANLCGADLSRADLNDADLRMPPWPWLEFFSMRFSRALGFMLLLFALPPLHAQAPVVPSADPESLFTSSNPRLNANKQVVLHIIRDLLEANHWEDANKYLTERYIQHNPYVASGLAPVRKFFNAKNATPPP
jgi:hypothetical protein